MAGKNHLDFMASHFPQRLEMEGPGRNFRLTSRGKKWYGLVREKVGKAVHTKDNMEEKSGEFWQLIDYQMTWWFVA